MLLPGHVLAASAGLRETDRLREVLDDRHRWHAVRGYLHERSGDLPAAGAAYAEAAGRRRARAPRPSGRPRADLLDAEPHISRGNGP
jgi:predicted RNA polymerase sigma factor